MRGEASRTMRGTLRAVLRLSAYLGLILVCVGPYLTLLAVKPVAAPRLARAFHRWTARIIGLEVVVSGQPAEGGGVLFASNHVSYLDIIALGSVTEASFVAKSEVAGWPLFGWLAKLQRTEFVARQGGHAGHQRDQLARRLARGDNLILFPEGTSTDGARVLTFKSPLFASAVSASGARVQPVSIAYTRLNGAPLGRARRPFVAWYGDMELAPHLLDALSLGRITVVIAFAEPVSIGEIGDRKALARHCETQARRGLVRALSGWE